MDLEKAARIAENRNRRARERFPLFADQLEEITAGQVQAAFERHAEKFEECHRALQERGDAFREQVARIVSGSELAELDRHRSILPDGPEYHADFWRRQLAARASRKLRERTN